MPVAMSGEDARVAARCPDCGATVEVHPCVRLHESGATVPRDRFREMSLGTGQPGALGAARLASATIARASSTVAAARMRVRASRLRAFWSGLTPSLAA